MTTLPMTAAAPRRSPLLPALGQLVRAELLRLFRNPSFVIGTIGFPVMFFGLFGLPVIAQYGHKDPLLGSTLLVNFGAYSLLSLAMFSFGSAVATERTGGWLRLLRASPLPVPLYFAAKVLAALIFSAVCLAALYAFAHFAGGVTLSAGLALTILGKLLLSMVALIGLGLMIGFLVNPQAAHITANIVSVMMSFASGLFMPLDQMPKFVQDIAPNLPAYHVGKISVNTALGQTSGEARHWLALAAFSVVFLGLAVWGMKRDESRE